MKKLFIIMFCLTLCLSLAACGTGPNPEQWYYDGYTRGYEEGYEEGASYAVVYAEDEYAEGYYDALKAAGDYIISVQYCGKGEEALGTIYDYFNGDASFKEAQEALELMYDLWYGVDSAAIDLLCGDSPLSP